MAFISFNNDYAGRIAATAVESQLFAQQVDAVRRDGERITITTPKKYDPIKLHWGEFAGFGLTLENLGCRKQGIFFEGLEDEKQQVADVGRRLRTPSEPKRMMTFAVPVDYSDRLRAAAGIYGTTMTEILKYVIDSGLDGAGNKLRV